MASEGVRAPSTAVPVDERSDAVALSGLQVYKLLPKTNCKDCGFPTCMAFAMQLAGGKVEIEKCPHVSPELAAELGEAAAPPIRKITVGVGERAVTVGEETVMFRHERRFEHAPGLALLLDDSVSADTFDALLETFVAQEFERVGQTLRVQMLAVASEDADRLAGRAARASTTEAPVVLMSASAAALRAAATPIADHRPLLYAATSANFDEMTALAGELGLPLVVKGSGLEETTALAAKALGAGLRDLVLDSSPATLADALRDLTLARRAAIKKRVKEAGFPMFAAPCRMAADPMQKTLYASFFVCKYAGFVLIDSLDPAHVYPLLVLCQNIYTDPQRPMQVDQGIYPLNNPGADSPVLLTTNFSLTYYTVAGEVENSRMPAWLMVMDVEGQSVLTAWAAGKFVPDAIAPFVQKSGVTEKVDHRRLYIPGYVAQISGELEEELGDEWQVVVGPREAADIPRFLRSLTA